MINTTAALIWRNLLASTDLEEQNSLLNCLSDDLKEILENTPLPSFDLISEIESAETELDRIDASWLTPFLRTLAEQDIGLFLSCLREEQQRDVKKHLLLTTPLPNVSIFAMQYLRKTLLETLSPPDLTPIKALPEDPLNHLLLLTSGQLHELIELLSMHDLAIEIKQIIETAKLKEIYSILTKAQQAFLKSLLHQKEPISFKKIGLANWKNNKESLKTVLIQRGINRIAKSLFNKDKSLIWYVAHRLDIEKGKMLLNFCTALDHPKAANFLIDQVLKGIQIIQHRNPPQSS